MPGFNLRKCGERGEHGKISLVESLPKMLESRLDNHWAPRTVRSSVSRKGQRQEVGILTPETSRLGKIPQLTLTLRIMARDGY